MWNCISVPNFIEIGGTTAEICDFQYYAIVWLENAYSRPFLRFFGGTFPPNDVTHRPNIQRDHPFGRTTSFEDYLVQLPRYKRAIMSKIAKFSDPPHKLPRGSQSLFNRPLPNLVNI